VHVLVVCTANVARSPLFAAMLAGRLGDGVTVSSAGTRAREGDPAAEGSAVLAEHRGLDLGGHRSRPVSPELVARADLVLTMSERQRDHCASLTAGAATRVYTVREFARLLDAVDAADAPPAPAGRLAWLRDQAHLARPRALPPTGPEDISDPIRASWPVWAELGEDLDDLLDRIAPAG
jgi:protein-tyrosine phosphatase